MKYYFLSFIVREIKFKKSWFSSRIVRGLQEVDNAITHKHHPVNWCREYSKLLTEKTGGSFSVQLISYNEITGDEYFNFQRNDQTLVKHPL